MAAGESIWMLAPLLACESPIEEAFLRALVDQANAVQLDAVVTEDDRAYPVTSEYRSGRLLQIRQQVSTSRYRYDFVLEILTSGLISSGLLMVECDGHDYHERTKEQAMRDRAKDREVQKNGAFIFRFTGRELHQNAGACATQSIDFLWGKVVEAEHAREKWIAAQRGGEW